MRQFVGSFRDIAEIVSKVGPDLDRAERYGRGAVMIETEPMVCANGLIARTWGPFENADMAHNYINVKRDRHRLANAAHHGEKGAEVSDDRTLLGHPDFKYRVVGAKGYFSRYLAQIQLLCTGALVSLAMPGEKDMPFAKPSDNYGIVDADDMDDENDDNTPEDDDDE